MKKTIILIFLFWIAMLGTSIAGPRVSGGGDASMTYPGAGIPKSTGSAWDTSYSIIFGTMTNGYYCTYTTTGTLLACNTQYPVASGLVFGSDAQGDMPVRGASVYGRLAHPGAAEYFLGSTSTTALGWRTAANMKTSLGYYTSGDAMTGSISGNAGSSTYASAVTVAASTTNASFYIPFFSATTGNLAAYVATGLYFNPSTGAATFPGSVTGTSFISTTADGARYWNASNTNNSSTTGEGDCWNNLTLDTLACYQAAAIRYYVGSPNSNITLSTGAGVTARTFTLPDAAATILTTNAVVTVAQGGTNAASASITAFNNITGYTASGATGTTSTNLVFSTSPAITTPTITTSIAAASAGGASLGTNAAEFSHLYLGDSAVIYGQLDSSNTITSSATGWTFAKPVTTADVTNDNYIKITNNSARAATASVNELYPEANVWKANQNGTESSVAIGPTAGQVSFTGPTAPRAFALPDAAATIQVASACTALTPAAGVTLTVTTYTNCFTDTVTDDENQTITITGTGYAGQEITILFTTAGTADEIITFAGAYSTGTLTLGTTAARFYTVRFISNGTNWFEVSRTAVQQ